MSSMSLSESNQLERKPFEGEMRAYVYPFMRMTMDHDRQFGGGALTDRESRAGAPAGSGSDDA